MKGVSCTASKHTRRGDRNTVLHDCVRSSVLITRHKQLYHHHHHHHHHVLFCVPVLQIGTRSRLHIKETKHSQNGARRSRTVS